MDFFRNIRDNGILKVANAAARLALIPSNGDIVEQLDDNSLWAWNSGSQTWTEIGGVPVYANLAAFPAGTTIGQLAIAADTGIGYEWRGSSWIAVFGPGSVLSIGTFDSGIANANGAHIDNDQLIMQSASISVPGLVNIGTQSFVGHKTFTGVLSGANSTVDDGAGNANFGSSVAAPDVFAAFVNIEGAGIVTLRMEQGTATTYNFNFPDDAGTTGYALTSQGGGSTPMIWSAFQSPLTIGNLDAQTGNAKGLALVSNVLSQQSASATVPGLVNNTTQSFGGAKTFTAATSIIGAADAVQLLIKGNSAQTNNILALQNSSSTVVASVNNLGIGNFLGVNVNPTGSTAGTLNIVPIPTYAANGNLTIDQNGSSGSFAIKQPTIGKSFLQFHSSGTVVIGGNGTANYDSSVEIDGKASNHTLTVYAASSTPGDLLNCRASDFTTVLARISSVGKLFSAGADMNSNKINNVTDPTAAQDAATKAYVDAAVSALNPATAVYAATTGSNLVGTYLNGVAGVGATFVITATGAFTIDGTTPPITSRILIKDQTSGFQNGIYNLTNPGSLGVSPIFTRALDYNTASDMNSAGLIPVINGTLNALSSWQQVATITTVGTDNLVFTEFTANPSLYLLKANNLSDVSSKSTSFNNLSPMTTGGDLIYGGASGTGTRLANGSAAQLLQSNGTTLAPTWVTPPYASTDIAPTVWVGPANNTANQNVTGLTFSTSILSFDALINVAITATANTWTTYRLTGTRQAASDWSTASLNTEITGDPVTGISFGITSAGQVQITIGSITGYASASTKFRAITL